MKISIKITTKKQIKKNIILKMILNLDYLKPKKIMMMKLIVNKLNKTKKQQQTMTTTT